MCLLNTEDVTVTRLRAGTERSVLTADLGMLLPASSHHGLVEGGGAPARNWPFKAVGNRWWLPASVAWLVPAMLSSLHSSCCVIRHMKLMKCSSSPPVAQHAAGQGKLCGAGAPCNPSGHPCSTCEEVFFLLPSYFLIFLCGVF